MAFVTGLIIAVLTAFVALLIAFKFFPKYQMSWKEKFLIAGVTIGVFIAILLVEYAIESVFGSINSALTAGVADRPAFGSPSFDNAFDTIMAWAWGLLEVAIGIVFAMWVGTGMLQKAGMESKDAVKMMGVWIVITAILWTGVLWLKSAAG